MAIPEHFRRNFETMMRAALAGDLALVECTDFTTGEPRYVVCGIVSEAGGTGDKSYVMTPFGHLHETPYDAYVPAGEPRTERPAG